MLVTREDAAGIATLTLNRPEKLNAITPALMVDLRGHLAEIAGDESVRCVILTGAGRSFCSGHDLTAIASGEQAPSRHYEAETIDALEKSEIESHVRVLYAELFPRFLIPAGLILLLQWGLGASRLRRIP